VTNQRLLAVVAGVKRSLPWWAKIGFKTALASVPVNYAIVKRFGLIEHGHMDDPEYAYRVISTHLARCPDASPSRVLELGPGDSVNAALIMRAFGANVCYMIDAEPLAATDRSVYERMRMYLQERGYRLPPVPDYGSIHEMLTVYGGVYQTDGIASLAQIPAESVDFVWSHMVLEHVRRDDVQPLLAELRRILKDDGVSSHTVDLRDHLGDSLHNLRFRESWWESPTVSRSRFYTNRLRLPQWMNAFEQAGFKAHIEINARWPALPIPKQRLDPAFRDFEDRDLLVQEFTACLTPACTPMPI
jgi:SAM-dependent methyltransferase